MEKEIAKNPIDRVIGHLPYRMALAGGWIDQPFISRENPNPPGSMVVVGLQPTFRYMDRAGMATSTRQVARRLWGDSLPNLDPAVLMHQLYQAENDGKDQPSGSQDMAGLIYPGINRLDYDFAYEGGYFPIHIESNNDPCVVQWLEEVIYLVPVSQRPVGYSPLGIQKLDPEWIDRLGQSGKDCYQAIVDKDIHKLGSSLDECMLCWQTVLPQTVCHPIISVDLLELLREYQSRYAGAMYSGCGGGYLIVVSDGVVPGGIKVKIRYAKRAIEP
jgi:hypothetical protein